MAMQDAGNLRLHRVRTTRVFEEICEQIRELVTSGQLKPGDKLPPERELAVEFRVSRPAVREALRSLEMSGVILLQKGVRGGAFIRSANSEALIQTLSDAIALRQLPPAKCVEAVRAFGRATIELACQRAGSLSDRSGGMSTVVSEPGPRHLTFVERVGQIARRADNEVLVVLMQSLATLVDAGTEALELEGLAEKLESAIASGDLASALVNWERYLAEMLPGPNSNEPRSPPKRTRGQ